MSTQQTGSDSVRVAFDVGPLHGHRTGIGNAVAWTLEAFRDVDSVALLPYVISMRAAVTDPTRRLPFPAALAHRLWAHRMLSVDRLLRAPDVVHGTNYVVPPTSCPRVVSVYDCWFLEHPDDVSSDVTRSARVLRRAVDEGAHVVASSEATAARVRALLDTDRVTAIHLGPPPRHLDVGGTWPPDLRQLGESAPYVLALGTVERRKNVPGSVHAFARLAAEHETVNLVIAGASGNDQPAVDRAIAALPAATAARIVQLGSVNQQLKARLLLNASVLAYVSLDEGFGFPVLEAQEVGVPVVASTAGSIPEVAGAGALLSSADDTDAIAANLHLAITSEAVRSKVIDQGHRNVERFSWQHTANQLAQLYTDLANGAPR